MRITNMMKLNMYCGVLLICAISLNNGGRLCKKKSQATWMVCLSEKTSNQSACAAQYITSYKNCFFKRQPKNHCFKRCNRKFDKCIKGNSIMSFPCTNGFNQCVAQCFGDIGLASSLSSPCWEKCAADYTMCRGLIKQFAEAFICLRARTLCRQMDTCHRRFYLPYQSSNQEQVVITKI